MRDVLTHHYFGVDDKVLWDTLGEDFEEFEKVINDMLKKLDNKSYQWTHSVTEVKRYLSNIPKEKNDSQRSNTTKLRRYNGLKI